jgi:hypothetical protein
MIGTLRRIVQKLYLCLRRSRDSPLNCTAKRTHPLRRYSHASAQQWQVLLIPTPILLSQSRFRDAVACNKPCSPSIPLNAMQPLHSTEISRGGPQGMLTVPSKQYTNINPSTHRISSTHIFSRRRSDLLSWGRISVQVPLYPSYSPRAATRFRNACLVSTGPNFHLKDQR